MSLYETLVNEVKRIHKERKIRKNISRMSPTELMNYYYELIEKL